MKKVGVLFVLPLMVFALERVNLIKDHSFEKDSEVWYTRISGSSMPYSVIVKCPDSPKAFSGGYSASCDTRGIQSDHGYNEGFISQGFCQPKILEDIDSLIVNYSVFPVNNNFQWCEFAMVLMEVNLNKEDHWKIGYVLNGLGDPLTFVPPYKDLSEISLSEDTLWHILNGDIRADIEELFSPPLSLDATVDSIILRGIGEYLMNTWRGQKVYFDDVRLMGYADYDVGIKAILDGVEDLEESSKANSSQYLSYNASPYTPAARIKNFGREPAEDFKVFAEIKQGDDVIYSDSLTWSLPSDTEDTVTFDTFTPPDTGTYTLRIWTFMDPDESDADDELSKELHFTGIAEPPSTHNDLITLDVSPSLTSPLHVSFSIPKGLSGTLTLFDLSGRRVESRQVKGFGSTTFTTKLSSGIYFVRLETTSVALTRKVLVVK